VYLSETLVTAYRIIIAINQ